MRKVTEDFIGTCQACFGEFKVNETSKRIVLHGYKRPGYGHIEGECGGVNHQPFEYDCSYTKQTIITLRQRARSLETQIANGKAGIITEVNYFEREWNESRQRRETVFKTIKFGEEGFERRLKMRIAELENEVRYLDRVADFLDAKVKAWKREPIIGIDLPATGKERALRKAYDPVEADALEERAKIKAARDAKPGKFKVIFFQKSLERPGTHGEIGETAWRKWIEAKDAQEDKFVADIKQWAKANHEGKIMVRKGYGSDLPRNRVEGDTYGYDVVIVHLPWEYRDEFQPMYSSAQIYENGPKVRSYTLLGLPVPH